jgi:hypothetical protein
MAYSQAQIEGLKKAIASGVLTVRHGETSTTFRSLAEMQETLRMMESENSGLSKAPRRTVAGFSKGL